MSQYILLVGYGGAGDFDSRCDIRCTGKELTLDEAKAKGLITPSQLRLSAMVLPAARWYEVKPGDEIVFSLEDWVWRDEDAGDGYLCLQTLTFVVPDGGLTDPIADIDKVYALAPKSLVDHYAETTDGRSS